MDEKLINPFVNSTKNVVKDMTGIEVIKTGEPMPESGDIVSYGVASIITFAGTIKGRLIIDIPTDLAIKMVGNMMGENFNNPKDKFFLSVISEMNNIIAGDANTLLNNTYSLGLRLAPPIVFTGNNMRIATSKIKSVTVICETNFAPFKINIAFQGGLES